MFSDNKDGVRIYVEESNVVPTSLQNDVAATPTPAFTPTISLKDHTDEVDAAATAMLVLKHGACAFDIKAGSFLFLFQRLFNIRRNYVISFKMFHRKSQRRFSNP